MKAIIGALAGLLVSGSAFAGPVYDVCEKQVESYVASELGTTISSIQYEWPDSRTHRSRAWVRTPKCDGKFVFELRGSYDDCHRAHYGRIPNYISQVWTTGSCSTRAYAAPFAFNVAAAEQLSTEIPDCPNGTMAVAQYDIHFRFQGYKCEKVSGH